MPKKFALPEGFALVTSDRPITTAALLAEIEKAGLRPATAAELEALIREPKTAVKYREISEKDGYTIPELIDLTIATGSYDS